MFFVDYTTELQKSKAALDLETALLNSSPGPRASYLKSPSLSACFINRPSTPNTPVDIKSVPQIRQLSCKKLIYSYTFGEPTPTNASNSSNDSSPKTVKKNTNRSPSSRNCRSSSVSKIPSSSSSSKSSNHFTSQIEWSSGPIPQNRKC